MEFQFSSFTNILLKESADTSDNLASEVQFVDGTGYCLSIDSDTFPSDFSFSAETGYTDNGYCYNTDGELICLRWFYDENRDLYVYAGSSGMEAYTTENDPYSDITDGGFGKVTLNLYIDKDVSSGSCLTVYLKDTDYSFITYAYTIDADETSYSVYVPAGNYQMTVVQEGFETVNEVYSSYVSALVGFPYNGDYNAYDDETYFKRYLVAESVEETENETETESEGETDAQTVTETSAESAGDASYLLEAQEEVVVETEEESTSLGVFCLIVTVIIWLVKRRKHYNRFF